MAHSMFSAKPLSEPILYNCQLNPYEQISVKFLYFHIFIRENAFENIAENVDHFVVASLC